MKTKEILVVLVLGLALVVLWVVQPRNPPQPLPYPKGGVDALPLKVRGMRGGDEVLSAAEFNEWCDRLVAAGAIDSAKFPREQTVRSQLNLLWALGLASKNTILGDKTEMMNPEYGGAGGFASTGGWTLAKGEAMTHYNQHQFFTLTAEQQALVDKISRGIYRP